MNKKKIGILIDATGDSGWIGGLYYKKNVLFSLTKNEYIVANYSFVVITEKENIPLFDEFSGKVQMICFSSKASAKLSHGLKIMRLICIAWKYHCRYIYPGKSARLTRFGIIPIHWYPDFQHKRLPEFFREDEIAARNAVCAVYAQDRYPLVLSSNDALNDYKTFYGGAAEKVYVLPFVSYIESSVRKLSPDKEYQILKKYALSGTKYICIMNQFWQHKNHIVVLNAMKIYFSKHPDSQMFFVFTGQLSDYRAPDYIERLKALFEEETIQQHSRMLGFIDRIEQIAIMKNAMFVIQPSLFEGWGTVVEDAKVLDKTILLSDIPVHREQCNYKCKMFDPYNAEELADLLAKEAEIDHVDDVEFGIADMHKRAKAYSRGFERLLKDQEYDRL